MLEILKTTDKKLIELGINEAQSGSWFNLINPSYDEIQKVSLILNLDESFLRNSLDGMIDMLSDGGRICIITFHSLEDRIVKTIFKRNENPCTCPVHFPVCVCGNESKGKVITRKPILPSEMEMEENPRSKSAKLRIFERKIMN